MKLKELESQVGTLSSPSKMPCYSYSIPAIHCKVGMTMRNIAGSICSKCYALKGRYVFPNVQIALAKRYASLANLPAWRDAMVSLIGLKERSGYFRWHDSGDVQSLDHLLAIMEIADRLPGIKFWIPTREYSVVEQALKVRSIPDNLTIRLSELMVDQLTTPEIVQRLRLPTSGVVSRQKRKDDERHVTCVAYKQGGKCGDCRACWDKTIDHITYPEH